MLTILSRWTEPLASGNGTRSFCLAECECGDISRYHTTNVTRGNSTRCRKCSSARKAKIAEKHGALSKGSGGTMLRKAYITWKGIKARCFNEKDKRYADYGGRGISMSESWASSFDAFIADIGLPPTAGHSIDRIDNSSWYCAENCRWETRVGQARNKRTNHLVEIDGELLPVSAWAERSGAACGTISRRLSLGWSAKDAVFGRIGKYLVDGVIYNSISDIATAFGMSTSGAYDRIKRDSWPTWVKL